MTDKKNAEKKRLSFSSALKQFFSAQNLSILAVWFFSSLVIALLLITPYLTKGLNLNIGDKSDVQIVCPEYLEFQTSANRVQTEQLKLLARMRVPEIYTRDEAIGPKAIHELEQFFNSITSVKSNDASLSKFIEPGLSQKYVFAIAALSTPNLNAFHAAVLGVLNGMYDNGITLNAEQQDTILSKEITNSPILKANSQLSQELLKVFSRQNSSIDHAKTEKVRNIAEKNVPPVKTIFREGQTLLYIGDVVTEDNYALLKRLGYIGLVGNINKILSLIFVSVLFVVLLERFIYYFKPIIRDNFKSILLLNIFLICAILSAKVVSFLPDFYLHWGAGLDLLPQPQYVSFIMMFIMLLVMLVDREVALFAGVIASLLVGIMFTSINVCIFNVVLSAFTVFNISGIYERRDLAKAGLNVGLVSVITILVLYDNHNPILMFFALMEGLVSCIFAAVIAIGIVPYFESMVGISSSMLYIELSNPNHPLLRRLMIEAPGSYHHSTIVAALAESAAEAIGANYLLARVGGLYHDVGKIKRPYFFVENQVGSENPHHKLSPRLSAIIILSHTKEGVEIAKEYGIPDEIINIIESHHGDSLVYYFYQKYIQKENVDVVSEDQFRYAGPLPETKEAAIVMLADTIEAVVRSTERPSPTKIESIVKRIVKEKIDEGQIAFAPLSLAELERLKQSFMKTLGGIYHARIDYSPEKIAKELEAKK